jgi:hypothetical protein
MEKTQTRGPKAYTWFPRSCRRQTKIVDQMKSRCDVSDVVPEDHWSRSGKSRRRVLPLHKCYFSAMTLHMRLDESRRLHKLRGRMRGPECSNNAL